MLVDTHAHLDSHKFAGDRAQMIERARAAGVAHILTISTSEASSRRAVALAEANPGVFAAVGVHPSDAGDWDFAMASRLAELARHQRVRAWGEIGLDYYWDYPRDAQVIAFREQIALAEQLRLPIIIHDRDAHADVLQVLDEEGGPGGPPVIMHSFSAGWEFAEQCLERGFYIGLGGPLTYPKNDALREVARRAPLERLLLETDCPYLPPQPYRGKRNEPAYLLHVAEQIAAVRGLTPAEVAAATTANAVGLFRLA